MNGDYKIISQTYYPNCLHYANSNWESVLGVPYITPCSEPPFALGEFIFPLTHLNSDAGPRVPCGEHHGAKQPGAGLGQSRQAGPAGSSAEAAETLRRRGRGRAAATAAPGGLGGAPLPPRPCSRAEARSGGRRPMRKLHQSPLPTRRRRASSGLRGQRGGGRGLLSAELGRLTHGAAAASSSFPSCCCCGRRLSAGAEGGAGGVCAEQSRAGRARQRRGACVRRGYESG